MIINIFGIAISSFFSLCSMIAWISLISQGKDIGDVFPVLGISVLFLIVLVYNFIMCVKKYAKAKQEAKKTSNVQPQKSAPLQRCNKVIAPFEINSSIASIIERIPPQIVNLLWFKNGPLQNYFDNDETVIIQSEPSAIDIYLPISNILSQPTPLGYYPSYEKLTPQERTVYLNWLTDITKPIDIGYVFIFYYGLERHLISGKSNDALDTILLLRKHHNNDSFLCYSENAVILYYLMNKKWDALQNIGSEMLSINVRLLLSALTKQELCANTIMAAHKSFGFTNERYVKNEPELFLTTLEKKLKEKYDKPSFMLKDSDISSTTSTFTIMLSNYSLLPGQRMIEFPDITSAPRLQTEIHSLLVETHESVKTILRNQRKKHNN